MAAPETLTTGSLAAPDPGGVHDEGQDGLENVAGIPRRRRKKRGVIFWLSVSWLSLIVFCAITASWLPLPDPTLANVPEKLLRPGADGHILGTDGLGRDVLARLVHGSRVSIIIGFASVGLGITAGCVLGMVVGYFRGWFERFVLFYIDVQLAYPFLVVLLALIAFVGQSLLIITMVFALLSIPLYTRVARANTLSVAQREYVMAARALGAKPGRVIFREILPNVALPVLAFGLLAVGSIIVAEGTLSYLGLSVPQPTPTWGSMIAEGRRYLQDAPHVAATPSLVMCFTVLSLTFVGDSLRALFDVRESGI